ncbi:D-Ala-D-Ala carboxypeptidase family metallohydrolase [Aurantiacibacter sediminis]|uniref:Peptidase M15A C-terminal domain-containing protein n=1 Tax=Aurantiacibacter sediminis TaxID=2793064 RepID=A0ABS0N2C5_9SPHN|nr:D-Ala-D-Ala carboxypeptidase family metallohydrolase [Aurantiacibacter sediminis]MBH5321867.1 hypothetical protein [Aurantiacibacter sediminis]
MAGLCLLAIGSPAAQAQSVAPGQAKADYLAWLAQSPENREDVRAFRTFLIDREVKDILPTWQLVRTSSSWRECSAERFEVAPVKQWANIVDTLAFVKREVQPAIGEVEALSAYRNEDLNTCSGGRPASAHRMFFAMDLKPVDDVDRSELIAKLCAAHSASGAEYSTGLGFYSGVRFHVDSSGFRKWGSDGRGSSSPCNRI